MFGDIGAPELLIILVIIILVFGGSRVAELGGALGKSVREFRRA
ncbi:MAG: twin-arginine translocase TatA/TatE family subunit, partial [Chloroflexota bacterium]